LESAELEDIIVRTGTHGSLSLGSSAEHQVQTAERSRILGPRHRHCRDHVRHTAARRRTVMPAMSECGGRGLLAVPNKALGSAY
jgi:hypothetical protein